MSTLVDVIRTAHATATTTRTHLRTAAHPAAETRHPRADGGSERRKCGAHAG
ncbi:hypothetical protein ACWD6R_10715 [Streptomyces sp. NPDC005151]